MPEHPSVCLASAAEAAVCVRWQGAGCVACPRLSCSQLTGRTVPAHAACTWRCLQAQHLRDLNVRGDADGVIRAFESGRVQSTEATLGEYVKALVKADRLDNTMLARTLQVGRSHVCRVFAVLPASLKVSTSDSSSCCASNCATAAEVQSDGVRQFLEVSCGGSCCGQRCFS